MANFCVKKILLATFMLPFAFATALHAGTQKTPATPSTSKQASVQVEWARQSDGQVAFDFKTIPAKGLKINSEGPWSLELKEHSGLEVAKAKLGKPEFKENLGGFSVSTKPQGKSGKVTYKMVVFVCTENKSQCFRDVQQGSFDWAI